MQITNEDIRKKIEVIYTCFDAVLNPYAQKRANIPVSLYEDIGWGLDDYEAVDNLVREVYKHKNFEEKRAEVENMLNKLKDAGTDIRSEDVIYNNCPAVIKMCIYYMAYIVYRENINADLNEGLLITLGLPSDILIQWNLHPRYDFLSQYCEHYYEVKVPERRCKCTDRKNYILDEKHYELLYQIIPKHWQCSSKSKKSLELTFQEKIEKVKQLIYELKTDNQKIIYPQIIRRIIYTLIYENYELKMGWTGKEILEALGLRKNLLTKWKATPEQDWKYDSYRSKDNPIKYMGKKIFAYNFMVRSMVYNLPYEKDSAGKSIPPINKFIEVFGGSANVTYTFPSLPYEVKKIYNDKDLYVSNFFYTIHKYQQEYKNKLHQLVKFIETEDNQELVELGKSTFRKKENINQIDRRILIARGIYKKCHEVAKFVRKKSSFDRIEENKEEMLKAAVAFTYEYSFEYQGKPSVSGLTTLDNIKYFINNIQEWEYMSEVFENVECFCDDAIDIVKSNMYDDKALFYLDSPYIATSAYDVEYRDSSSKNDTQNVKDKMLLGEFTEMCNALKKCNGKWIFSCRAKAKEIKDEDGRKYYDQEEAEQIYKLLKQYEGVGKYIVYLATKGMRDKLELWGDGILEIMIVNFKPATPAIEVARHLNITRDPQIANPKSEYRVLGYNEFLKIIKECLIGS